MTRPKRTKSDLRWGLGPADGDFYSPELSSDARSGWVPGLPDVYRRRFLERAGFLVPELLTALTTMSPNDEQALSNWADRWHLKDAWCLALARDTIRWHQTNPDARGWAFQDQYVFRGHFPFDIPPLGLEQFCWDPTWRRRQDFKEYVLRKVAKQVDAYCDRIKAKALKAGLKRAARKNEPRHFDWTVRYQVSGESYGSIAKGTLKFSGGRQTVRKAVTDLAKIMSLTLRPSTSKSGRRS